MSDNKATQVQKEIQKAFLPRLGGFGLQFFLIAILPLTILLLIVAFGSQSLHNQAMHSLVGDRDLKTVNAASSSIQRELVHLSSSMEILSRSLGAKTDLANVIFTQDEILATFDGGAAILSDSGEVLNSIQGKVNWQEAAMQYPELRQLPDPESIQPRFIVPATRVSDPVQMIFVVIRLRNGNSLAAGFTPTQLIENTISNLVKSSQTAVQLVAPGQGDGSYALLYQGGGLAVADPTSGHAGFAQSLAGQSGVNYSTSSAGEYVVTYAPILPAGWGLVIEESWQEIASPYLSSTQSAPLVIVPAFLLALIAIWFGVRRIVSPLQKLEGYASSLANGDFGAIHRPVGGIEEIRNLQAELIDMADRLKTAQMNLRSYIGAINEGIENERRSLARELHDDTIQSLIALNQRLQLMELDPAVDQSARLSEVRELVTQAMTNLRRMIHGLRPISLEDLGLVSAIETLVNETSRSSTIPIAFHLQGDEQRLDPQTEMSLYRMTQESLNNIVRHSEATRASVKLTFSADQLLIQIEDNGKGFVLPGDSAAFPARGHFGLLGLSERADLIKAKLTIRSEPGKGTRITIRVKTS